jgi:CRP-like cAMP-binding protein
MTELPFREGEALITEGNRPDSFIVIVEGTADVVRGGQVIAQVGPGDLLGEVGLLTNEDRNATVRAASDMWVLVADRGRFSQLMDEVPGVARAVADALASRR